MWGDMDEISIPISVVAPDGTKMGADAFTGTKVEGNKLVAQQGRAAPGCSL